MNPVRHQASIRSRKKALHLAKNLEEQLNHIERKLHKLLNENISYSRGRIYKLINRLRAEEIE